MGKVARLRIVDLSFGLDLADGVETVEGPDHDAPLVVVLLHYAAEEVIVR